MISIKLILSDMLQETASRQNGAILRHQILEHLTAGHLLEIDCINTNFTPSFTDEAFGLLCNEITHQTFVENIKFVNLSLTHKSLLIHVLSHRFLIG